MTAKTKKPEDNVVVLGKELSKLKAKKAKLEEELKKVNGEITDLSVHKLPQLMDDREIEKVKIAGAGTLYVSQEVFVGLLADDRPQAYEWMRKEGHSDLVKDWIFPQTLKAFVKEQLEQGKPLPAFFKATFQPTAKLRKG